MTEPLRKGDRVWPATLKQPGTAEFSLRPVRGPRVIVTMHRSDCDECIGYAREIASVRDQVASWGGDIVVVAGEGTAASRPLLPPLGVPLLEDPEHILAVGRFSVIIVDQWGEVYFASEPEPVHCDVTPDDVVEWVKFIAIQCPECEGPEGEWRNL
jgi:hypothetical protein